MKLYIIAGHGNGDPGACAGGYTEAALVRKLAKRIKRLGGASVTVLDTSRNWYADGGIYRLDLPEGAQLLELHLDSAGASARGGHVIIDADFSADKYDKALASFIGGMFPGRAKTLVKRNDLGNPNAAQAAGISYRLLECCFISNPVDRKKFITNIDALAKGILAAFGIKAGAAQNAASKPQTKPATNAATGAVKKKKKTVDQVAHEVIEGKWGNGEDRKKRLKAAGYDYAKVQARVNALLK
jgi:hypothetical protein